MSIALQHRICGGPPSDRMLIAGYIGRGWARAEMESRPYGFYWLPPDYEATIVAYKLVGLAPGNS